ncbi:YukJ family protein [Paenibacillus crassostreae]|uniref:DUF2278 domain-containing protein n=1 Tax=Paenibacillus crassostreae TaxID=1763538 RepID=A0A167APV8_9BACL|nr:YukJ family protein [Paenibacillus crassostreae]AOZ93760.1 hypothetical protein LPB68_17220 [Paenibacillus crassostreae]OAB71294.1 hypothetical protein PNBC_20090 [Paenibacillus crassostreae]
MPVQRFGVLKCKVTAYKEERDDRDPHFQIEVVDDQGTHYRISVNVMSRSEQSEVLYLVDEDFNASAISILPNIKLGFTPINHNNRDIALDYIRSSLFDPSSMKPLSHHITGPNNDLNDLMEHYIQKAINEDALLYVYGSRWGPEKNRDHIFRFQPGNGLHNVHMNQGNKGRWKGDNASYQDGGLLIQFKDHWVGIFLAFLSQSWCTDEKGHPTEFCGHTQMRQV